MLKKTSERRRVKEEWNQSVRDKERERERLFGCCVFPVFSVAFRLLVDPTLFIIVAVDFFLTKNEVR